MYDLFTWKSYEEMTRNSLRVFYEEVFTKKCLRPFYEEIISWLLRVFCEENLSRYLRVDYEELFSSYLRGIVATSLRGILVTSLRRIVLLRLYDKIYSSLSYDELARKYVLRQTCNEQTRFLANSS